MIYLFTISFSLDAQNHNKLNQQEIEEIKTQKNFFFINELKDKDPLWSNIGNQYAEFSFRNCNYCLSFNDIIKKTLYDGFAIKYKIEELYRTNMDAHVALGHVIPRISILVGDGVVPVDANSLFLNLFGFLSPSNWYNLISKRKVYEATKHLLLKTILDEHCKIENQYIGLHDSIKQYEILTYYFEHFQILIEYLNSIDINSPELKEYCLELENAISALVWPIKVKYNELAASMAIEKDENGYYSADTFSVEHIKNYQEVNKSLKRLYGNYKDKEKFLLEVLKNSVELRSIKNFYEVSKYNVGVTAFGSILNFNNENTNMRLGLSLGYDTLPKILVASSNIKTAKIDVQKAYVDILNTARNTHDTYINNYKNFIALNNDIESSRLSFKTQIKKLLNEKVLYHSLIWDFKKLIQAEVNLSNAFHSALKSQSDMQRMLVKSENDLIKFLPNNKDIDKAAELFLLEYKANDNESSHLDKIVRYVHKTKDLITFLNGEILDINANKQTISKEIIEETILKNLQWLIYSSWRIKKSRNFYKTLYSYLIENSISIPDEEKMLLLKKSKFTLYEVFLKKSQIELSDSKVKSKTISRKIKDLKQSFSLHEFFINGEEYFTKLDKIKANQ